MMAVQRYWNYEAVRSQITGSDCTTEAPQSAVEGADSSNDSIPAFVVGIVPLMHNPLRDAAM